MFRLFIPTNIIKRKGIIFLFIFLKVYDRFEISFFIIRLINPRVT